MACNISKDFFFQIGNRPDVINPTVIGFLRLIPMLIFKTFSCSHVPLLQLNINMFCVSIVKAILYSYVGHTYLGPLGIELTSFFSIFQCRLVLPQFEKRCWTVTIQDAVLWVSLQDIGVQMNSSLKVTTLTRLIALLHFPHEFCFAETIPGPSVSRNTPERSARCPRTEDWKLQKWTRGGSYNQSNWKTSNHT